MKITYNCTFIVKLLNEQKTKYHLDDYINGLNALNIQHIEKQIYNSFN